MSRSRKWGLCYLSLLAVYALFSYTLVDRNLILSSNPIFLVAQSRLWHIVDQYRYQWVAWYGLITLGLYYCYVKLMHGWLHKKMEEVDVKKIWAGSIIVLALSYPGLSHDIFNYMFNAKMVWTYGANPHEQVALDFASDPWLRHMHNTHTPAPYGYGWTLISLLPSILGQNHLKLTLFLFRLLMIGSLILLVYMQRQLATSKALARYAYVFGLNPLVLIETVGNIHNDVVMMALALGSLLIFKQAIKLRKLNYLVLAILIFIWAVGIKFAVIMMLVGLALEQGLKTKRWISRGGLYSLLHGGLLTLKRSQRFLPWYLIWPLSFITMTKEKRIRMVMIAASLGGMLGYIPYMLAGEYNKTVLMQRTWISFGVPILILIYTWIRSRITALKTIE